MKKRILPLLAAAVSLCSWADTVTSVPSPALTTKPVTITISCSDMGSQVYLYSWCVVNGSEITPFTWDGVVNSTYQMTYEGSGTYSYTISSLQTFYGLSASQLEGLTQLGVIARSSGGAQTSDLFVTVEQGRTDAYSGGEGTAEDPYIIAKAADLVELSTYSSDWAAGTYFKQTASFSAGSIEPIGSIGSPFKGNYDGQGYSIKGLSVSQSTLGQPAGLFGAIGDGAVVKHLALTDASVSGAAYVGALVGYAAGGSVSECYTSGNVKGSSIAVGGLVGINAGASISDCYSTATVSASGQYAVGGLVGKNLGTVKNTYASGTVTAKNYAGGLVGANYANLSNSAAINAGMSASNNYVGRVGGNDNPSNISTNNIGWYSIPKSDSIWTAYADQSLNGSVDLTTKEAFSNTLGWDFSTVWDWQSSGNKSYPVLACMVDTQAVPFSDTFYQLGSGVDEVAADTEVLFEYGPNPLSDRLGVTTASPISMAFLTSMAGIRVASATPSAPTCSVTLPTADIAPGIYVLSVVTSDGNTFTAKVIKK